MSVELTFTESVNREEVVDHFFEKLKAEIKNNFIVDYLVDVNYSLDFENDIFAWIESFVKIKKEVSYEFDVSSDFFLKALVIAKLELIREDLSNVYPLLGQRVDDCISEIYFCQRGMKSDHKNQSSFLRNTMLLFSLGMVGCSVFIVNKNGETVKKITDSQNYTVATLSPVDLYGQIVRDDQNQKILDYTLYAQANGSPDYSNLGYASCVVDSDCLSGVQTCQAGVIPNSPDPGYCVPK